jgi:predicted hydrolase (HD superfamily)
MYAYSLLRPEGFNGMKAKWVKKRIKDKSFAAWVDREHLKNCETYLWITLDEFIPDMLEAFTSTT